MANLDKRLRKLERGDDTTSARSFLIGLMSIEAAGTDPEPLDLPADCHRRDLAAGRTTAATVDEYLKGRLDQIIAADGQARYNLFNAAINSIVTVKDPSE